MKQNIHIPEKNLNAHHNYRSYQWATYYCTMAFRRLSVKTIVFLSILLISVQLMGTSTKITSPDTVEPDDAAKDVETESFHCVSGSEKSNRLRLYLSLENLVVDCVPLNEPRFSRKDYSDKIELFISSGIRPTMAIYNSTNSATFPMKLNVNTATWRVDIPRYKISINTVAAPGDEWTVEFNILYTISVYVKKELRQDTAKATLLDVTREPILQWTIGEEISPHVIVPHLHQVVKLQVSQSPCARDVAVLAPVFASGGHTGVILSVTRSAFTAQARWFNATKSLCSLISEVCVAGCTGISIVDLKLTNCHLFLLTNRGLFMSQDLLSPVTGPLNFTLVFLPALAQMDYSAATIWFSSECLIDRIFFSDDTISLVSSQIEDNNLKSRCVYSKYPFKKWFQCNSSTAEIIKNPKQGYLSFVYDRHQHTGLLLSRAKETDAMVSVFELDEEKPLNPRTKFPPVNLDFRATGIFLWDNNVILYGSEVWTSLDRGSTFNWVFSLDNQVVVNVLSCNAIGVVVLLTDHGHLYIIKSGLTRYAWLNETLASDSTLVCDYLGILIAIQLDKDHPSGFIYKTIKIKTLIEKNEVGFARPLALQYTTDHTVLLHENVAIQSGPNTSQPLTPAPVSHFTYGNVGKVIYFSDGGMMVITDVFQSHYLKGFSGAVAGEILEPFRGSSLNEEPIQSHDLLVKEGPGNFSVTLQLRDLDPSMGFNSSHIGKTVVAPGFSSYLITELLPSGHALAEPTMPALVPPMTSHHGKEWLLFNTSGWSMKEGPCYHSIEAKGGLQKKALVRINVREQLNFTFKSITSNYNLSMVYHKKLMRVVLTNPVAIRVNVFHYWDNINNHMLNLTAFSHLCKKVGLDSSIIH
ncbi:hypothetical protein UPYG_G00231630 [Umbra pygmaea]|uniref:Cation channel sperm-associated protein subunit beta n=1 Tax=Umbra pygmaea TaxID=75934 RepID=A0ABD0WIJ7_UMBPY